MLGIFVIFLHRNLNAKLIYNRQYYSLNLKIAPKELRIFLIQSLKAPPNFQYLPLPSPTQLPCNYFQSAFEDIYTYWWPCPRLGLYLLTHWGWDKIAAIFQTTLSNAIIWMKMHKFWLYGSKWQYSSTGSDNGMVPTRQQAIIWTNDTYLPMIPMMLLVAGLLALMTRSGIDLGTSHLVYLSTSLFFILSLSSLCPLTLVDAHVWAAGAMI